jgi:hypothetical protein
MATAKPVQLQYKAPDKAINYQLSSDARSVFSLYELEKVIIQSSETTFKLEKGTDKDAGVPLKLTVLDQQITADGLPAKSTEIGQSVEMLIEAHGNILKSSDVNILENFQDMIITLPTTAVEPGHTWTNIIPLQLPDAEGKAIDAKAKLDCTLTAVKPFNGVPCAWISTKLVISPINTNLTEMKAVSTGKLYIDLKTGIIHAMKNDLAMTMNVFKVIQKKKVLFTSLTLKMVNTLKMK